MLLTVHVFWDVMLCCWVSVPIVPSGTTECHYPGRHNPQKQRCKNLKSPNMNFF